jgi:hypothetical protein
VRVLAEKLYRRNPREWKKGGHASIEAALDRLLDPRTGWRPAEPAGGAAPTPSCWRSRPTSPATACGASSPAWAAC